MSIIFNWKTVHEQFIITPPIENFLKGAINLSFPWTDDWCVRKERAEVWKFPREARVSPAQLKVSYKSGG